MEVLPTRDLPTYLDHACGAAEIGVECELAEERTGYHDIIFCSSELFVNWITKAHDPITTPPIKPPVPLNGGLLCNCDVTPGMSRG